jgi:hypothetical protein
MRQKDIDFFDALQSKMAKRQLSRPYVEVTVRFFDKKKIYTIPLLDATAYIEEYCKGNPYVIDIRDGETGEALDYNFVRLWLERIYSGKYEKMPKRVGKTKKQRKLHRQYMSMLDMAHDASSL